MITVTINGARRRLPGPTALADLVATEVGGAEEGIAVGLNRSVVPRPDWPRVRVGEGDEVEIIAPFAGG